MNVTFIVSLGSFGKLKESLEEPLDLALLFDPLLLSFLRNGNLLYNCPKLNVEFNSPEITDYNFSIYDLNGKKIFSSDNNTARVNNFYVNLEFMENGLYNCVVKTNESVYSKSLVIIK